MALLLANARYWSTLVPIVRAQLERWERRAQLIADPHLRDIALDTLHDEGFNSQVAATLATLAPRGLRTTVVEAIVALEVLYDYLDSLVEQPLPDPIRDGDRLYLALTHAVTPDAGSEGGYHEDGYLADLATAVNESLAKLPSAEVIADVALHAAARNAGAQVRAHAVARVGASQLEEWAMHEAASTELDWREYLMGAASSVLVIHALIAAAADPRTTHTQAGQIDRVYLAIGALSTMLDSLIDYERDARLDSLGYIRYYKTRDVLADQLASVVRHAISQARGAPNEAHHVMTLVGVAAYYLSAPEATSDFARPITKRIVHELQPLITPTLAVMRAWRIAKRLRKHRSATAQRQARTSHDTARRPSRPSAVRYLAIITDGNGRWARARGLPVSAGHEAGADALKTCLRHAAELGIQQLTVYSFSTENWSRPAEEVVGLISMLARRIASETPELHEQGVRMRFIGRRSGLANELVEQMRWAEQLTAENTRLTLFIAVNYGGRAEILDAASRFHGSTEQEFRACLYAPDMHDPDLVIRTGGERRLSNYLMWQAAYSELVFRQELWPDFTRATLEQSIAEFNSRQRRFAGGQHAAGLVIAPGARMT